MGVYVYESRRYSLARGIINLIGCPMPQFAHCDDEVTVDRDVPTNPVAAAAVEYHATTNQVTAVVRFGMIVVG
jgi:hypothetical protein